MRFRLLFLAFAVLPGFAGQAQANPFQWRGVLEGFYGRPWSWEDRWSMLPWLAAHHFNLLVMAAKDDPSHRLRWREPLSDDEKRNLKRIVSLGREHGVSLGWTLSPFDARYADSGEFERAAAKLESVLELGVRWAVLAFDDTDPDISQIDFANKLLVRLSVRHPDLQMVFVPALYWGAEAGSSYLRMVALKLDTRFIVGWTGPGILCRTITAEDGKAFAGLMKGRSLALGDNYPVQDRLTANGPLFLGPLTGRDPGLSVTQEAYLANASPLPWLSRLPLATAGDFAYGPDKYDPERSWETSAEELLHEPALVAVARESRSSWLTNPGEETGSLEPAVERCIHADNCSPLETLLLNFGKSAEDLRKIDPRLAKEFAPWVHKAAALSRAGLQGLALLREIRSGLKPSDSRVKNWRNLRLEADREEAMIGDVAPDRFFNAIETALEGNPLSPSAPLAALARRLAQGEPGSEKYLRDVLGRLIQASSALRNLIAGPSDPARSLLPWISIFSDESKEALKSLDRRSIFTRSTGDFRLFKLWGLRLRFLPLMACRNRLENFLDEGEKKWLKPDDAHPNHLSWPFAAYLKLIKWVKPRSFLAQLERALEQNDAAGLNALMTQLEALSFRFRRPEIPEEIYPWLDKIAVYGRLVRLASEYQNRLAHGGTLSESEKSLWIRRRENLSSANGLELCLNLKLTLEALQNWAKTRPRSKYFDVPLPPNPAEAY